MKSTKCGAAAALILRCALVYAVFDWPIRATGFLRFGSFVGIKCLLPVLFGALFGPYGGIGCALGAALVGTLMRAPLLQNCFECVSCVFVATALWLVWHGGFSAGGQTSWGSENLSSRMKWGRR